MWYYEYICVYIRNLYCESYLETISDEWSIRRP